MSEWSQRPDALERDFQFDDSAAAMAFVNADHALARRIDEVTSG